MSKTQRSDLLREVWLFSRCTNKELAKLSEITTVVSVEADRVLVREDETGDEFFVVVAGHAAVSRHGTSLGKLGPGSFFGEMALLDGGPRVATVVAVGQMSLLVLSRREFDALLHASMPSVTRRMLSILGQRLRCADEQLAASHRLSRADGMPTGT